MAPMAHIRAALLAAAAAAVVAQSDTLGPASIWWPPDRVWSPDTDNIGPCGSIEGVTNRTKFPLSELTVYVFPAPECS